MENIEIRKLSLGEDIPWDLLHLADPSVEAVNDYLKRGICYIAILGIDVIGVYVLLPTRPFTVELVNVAVKEEYHGKGCGKLLVRHAIRIAQESHYKIIELGTGNAGILQLALYQKCGFRITGIDFDFFRKHYEEPMFENGIECRDMIRLSLDL